MIFSNNIMISTLLSNEPTAIVAIIAALAASTALLLIFIILLFACKPFRNIFFRVKAKPEKKQTKKSSVVKSEKQSDAKADFENNAAVAKKQSRTKKDKTDGQTPKTRVRLAYSDSVPTVPLFTAPKATGKTKDEDIMKRTHEALMSMSYSKPRATMADANDYVPTVVIPKTNTNDKTAYGVKTGERKTPVTNSNIRTGERTATTHERSAAASKTGPHITASPRTATTGTTKPAAKTVAVKSTAAEKRATTATAPVKKPTVKTVDKK